MNGRLEVGAADVRNLGEVAAQSQDPVAVVAVPVVQRAGEDLPAVAEGVPERVTLGPLSVDLALPSVVARRNGFAGKPGESLVRSLSEGPAVVYLGCGRPERLTTDVLRMAAASLVRVAGREGRAIFVLPAGLLTNLAPAPEGEAPLPPAPRRAAQALAEGAILASYRFTAHKSAGDRSRLSGVIVAGSDIEPEVLAEGTRRGAVVAGAVSFARDLVNEPPSTMTPRRLTEAVRSYLEDRSGVALEVWDEHRIESESLGGLLGVARGSAEPPRLVRVTFEPPDPVEVGGHIPHVVLVGKGITFDSGGLSLKTADGMVTMKTDMSGAAAVLAAVGVCGELGVRVRVTAIAPVTENMPGGRAQKPGDVLTIRNGQTIEVLNTDAEGRLVLADALVLASESHPDAIVDLATLTGACVVALGRSVAGLFSNDEVLTEKLGDASVRAGERIWPLPLVEEYQGDIESEVADMKNIGKAGQAGAIVAALLLERFVGDGTPWAHLDIAGPARSDEGSGVLVKGATGFGVRTLVEFLERLGVEPMIRSADEAVG